MMKGTIKHLCNVAVMISPFFRLAMKRFKGCFAFPLIINIRPKKTLTMHRKKIFFRWHIYDLVIYGRKSFFFSLKIFSALLVFQVLTLLYSVALRPTAW